MTIRQREAGRDTDGAGARDLLREWGFGDFVRAPEGVWESVLPARVTKWHSTGLIVACHGRTRLWLMHVPASGGAEILYGGKVDDLEGLAGFLGSPRH